MQILQKTKRYTANGFSCELKRTKKVAHCGQDDHMVREFNEEYNYEQISFSREDCHNWIHNKEIILPGDKGVRVPHKLKLNHGKSLPTLCKEKHILTGTYSALQ